MRIAFTGPESSGKTTFSKWLQGHLPNCILKEEYAREYLENLKINSASALDFQKIVQSQCALFTRTPLATHEIFDTDIFVLRIWNNEVFQTKLEDLEFRDSYKMDIHFLCAPDFDWKEDPLRSAPDKDERDKLFELCRKELEKNMCFFVILSGSIDEKKLLIYTTIQSFLSCQKGSH